MRRRTHRAGAAWRTVYSSPKGTVMAKQVKKIPDGYTAVTPYLTIKGAAKAIEFYKKAFGAEEVLRLDMPDGKIAHAEISIGGARVMLHDETPQFNALSPQTIGDSASSLMLYVNDADAVVKRAVDAGATLTMEVADQFYSDRCGNIKDPFGHKWSVATHIEDVELDEIKRRAAKMFEQQKGGG
jgi:PhnB protein